MSTGGGVLDDPARAAAVAAARERVEPGATIGLGSGRAVVALVQLLARTWPQGPPLRAVVSSATTEAHARAAGIELVPLEAGVSLDVMLDGADEIDPRLRLVKGGGGALLREKLVMATARQVTIMAEEGKYVERLGATHALPVEVVPFGWQTTRRRLLALLPEASLRVTPDGQPVRTDEGHYLLDCRLPRGGGLVDLAAAVKATLGVVEHGLFLGFADEAFLGDPDGTVRHLTRSRAR